MEPHYSHCWRENTILAAVPAEWSRRGNGIFPARVTRCVAGSNGALF
jgi:hypothetical protein